MSHGNPTQTLQTTHGYTSIMKEQTILGYSNAYLTGFTHGRGVVIFFFWFEIYYNILNLCHGTKF